MNDQQPQIERIPISELTLYDNNPRKINKQQFEKLCMNIKRDPEFFNNRPCLVNRVGEKQTVYAGNQRLRAAKKLGWKEVPCIVENDLDEQVVKDRMILDNKSFGEFDDDILANVFDPIKLIELGFEESYFNGWEEEEKPKGEKKKKCCPNCGCEF
jgi:hypothetical protein